MKNKNQKQNKKDHSKSDKFTEKRGYQKKAAKVVKEKLSRAIKKLGEE